MEAKNLMVMKVLINHFHGGEHEGISALPEEEQEGIKKIDFDSADISIVTRQPWQAVAKVHWSWLLDPIKQLPEEEIPFVVASLSQEQQKSLAKRFGIEDLPEGLSDPMKHLFLDRLYTIMPIKGILPLAFMPKQPLAELLDLSKRQIVDLIDCLGIYDVVGEIKQIVDRQQLSKLVESLTKTQQGFLKEVIHDKDRWSPSKLGLDRWGGDAARLKKALHIRGLMRLAKALKDHSDDFMAHVYRRLDTGRAAQIQKYRSVEESEQVIYNLGAEVKKAIHYIKSL